MKSTLGSVKVNMLGKREEIFMGHNNNFRQSCFNVSNGRQRKRRDLEMEQQWRANYGAFFELKTEEVSF
jgi:hypothetical protein